MQRVRATSETREIEHADDAVLKSVKSDIPEAEDDDVELTESDVSGKITVVPQVLICYYIPFNPHPHSHSHPTFLPPS